MIFGGTFDPPHVGHVAAASAARELLGTERVLAVVAANPWQKSARREVTAARHRLAMTRLAFESQQGLEVSDIELGRSGPTYTIDTVEALRRSATETHTEPEIEPEIVLVVGPDAAANMSTWHRADELAEQVTLAVLLPASGSPEPEGLGELEAALDGWRVEVLRFGEVKASATRVRELLRQRAAGLGDDLADELADDLTDELNVEINRLVPAPVLSYIDRFKLYSAEQ